MAYIMLLLLALVLFIGLIVGAKSTERNIHEYTLINCIQIGEETLNGETSTFYTCEGIR